MKKIAAALLLGFALLFGTFACAEELKIVATNFPCYDFARQIAGEAAEVTYASVV